MKVNASNELRDYLEKKHSVKVHWISLTAIHYVIEWPGGGTQRMFGVERCGWGTQTLTLFKTEISDFATLFKIFETTSKYI